MDTSIESDGIIDPDGMDVDPEDTGNVHSDEELDAGSDDECPYEYNPWNESDEEDDGYENLTPYQSARGAVELDEVEDSDHGDDEESDQDSPGDARDPQSNIEEREQGGRGEQDGSVDGHANDNTASDEHPLQHYARKRDYNKNAYDLALAVKNSENWTGQREELFTNEFFKAVVPEDHWKALAKFLRSDVLGITDDGDGGMSREDKMAWSTVPGAMAVTLGLVERKIPTPVAPRGVVGATVGTVNRVTTGSPNANNANNAADWKDEVLEPLKVEEWTDAQKENCGSARVVDIKQQRTRSGSSARVLQPIDYFQNFFDKKMFELLAKETVKHTSEIAQQDESQKPLAYKHKWPPRWADTMSRKWVVSRDKCVREIRKFFGVLIGLGVNGSKHSVKEMMSDDWSVEVGWLKDPKLGITSDWFHAILLSLRCQSDDWMEQTARRGEFGGYVLPSDVVAQEDGTYRRGEGGEALTNGELTHNHRVRKVGRILEMFHQNCLTKYTPGCYVSMDEQRVMMGHKTGSYRQHAKNKPIKTGVTIISVCEAGTGYLITFAVDIGVLDPIEGKKWPYIKTVASNCAGKFHKLVADNWYMSVKFLKWALEHKLYVCGTCMKSVGQTGFPADIMSKKGQRHARAEILWRWAAPQLSAIRWQDTGIVHFLSNFLDPREEVQMKRWIKRPGQRSTHEDVTAPLVADVYNNNMAGCDQSDQLRAALTIHRKTRKWWHPLGIFWLIDQSLVNAYILYKDECKHFKEVAMSRKKFHKAVAESLLGDYEPAAPPKSRASFGSTTFNQRKRSSTSQDATIMCMPVRIPGKQKQCKHCYITSGTAVTRRRTGFMCKCCNVALCIGEEGKNCWEEWHNPGVHEE